MRYKTSNRVSQSFVRPIEHSSRDKRRKAEQYKEIYLSETARVEHRTVSQTISLTRKDDNYYLYSSEVKLAAKYQEKSGSSYYNQYFQAIKSLFHNINFILAIQNFANFDYDLKYTYIVDLEGNKQKGNFAYDNKILSAYRYKIDRKQIKNPEELNIKLMKILQESQRLIEMLAGLTSLEQDDIADPAKLEALNKTEEFKNKLLLVSNSLISALKHNKINLNEFENQLSFESLNSSALSSGI